MSREAELAHEGEEHHKSTLDRLIYMGNQIGWFFNSQPEGLRIPGILDHIQHFWDPRMRAEIFRHIDEGGGAGLDANVLEALTQLKLAEAGQIKTRGEAGKIDTGQQRAGEAPPEVTKQGLG
ncbi:formate dehydrogenase subunit delta [Chenggangzhangella methanolivorans]|uniref:Formate dehydrogenase subunit delta n=1 Tax=Chenggangzhangella methanolivorans TaxID=1437009 RepID=A0A9E6R8V8_9HYPH|nr:formate dehydrogenase subunit delta [Chenggangzhangella methanolivorans]QZO00209.1 formate dehydrogenase subunit delta [Chenggangzhangella methanolivorans]